MRVIGRDEMGDTTLLIQGPLMEDTYKFYCRFYPDVPKVFSTWEGGKRCWNGLSNLHSVNDVFIESEPPNKLGSWERRAEMSTVGVLVGLNNISTKYSVVLRGDEWYSNLSEVGKSLAMDNGGKIFMIPAFMKKWDVWPYRMSDHIIAGRTEDIRLMFEAYLVNLVTRVELHPQCWPLPSQSILALGYMKRKISEKDENKEGFKKLFGIIDLDALKLYKVCSDSGDKSWYSNFRPSVSSLDDL